ncbi:MAG: HAD-IC family P-type ATPase [Chloroflexi bacterium]|nr:HAD-IC family P-type ATPase [Chloroflexota bacterium]
MKAKDVEFKIHGMDCAEEVSILKREIGPLVGGAEHLAFDILNAKMTVLPSAASVEPSRIIEAVNRVGMRAEPYADAQPGAAEMSFWQRRGRTIMTTASGAFSAGGFLTHATVAGSFLTALGSEGLGVGHEVPLVSRVLYAAGVITGAWYVAPRGWLALRRLKPEAATVSFLFALSLALESWSIGRAKRAVEALLEIAPPLVRVLRNGTEQEISPVGAAVGEQFLVRPGERIALDGVVVRGNSDVNQAPITGESVPVLKEPGSPVFAGTVNGNGVLEVEITRLAGETTLAQIIRMVGEAQRRRAPSEQWVDRFAHYYTPSVFALAILVATVPPLAFGVPVGEWVYRALVLLVIGCPCALVISTPVSIVASLAAAARQGVLVKGGVHMETPARLKAIAFDKTGTLTRGSPSVVDVLPMNEHTESELLEIAAAIESHSDHPLAQAITAHARTRGISFPEPRDLQTVQGKGVTASLDGRLY